MECCYPYLENPDAVEYEREKDRMFIFLNNRSLMKQSKKNCEEAVDSLRTK